MFVQINPSSADIGETLCSLNFASRVRGIEYGPAHKHADHSELLKYKQMAEKLKRDVCRSLQDKVRDLENQLAQERKLILKEGKPATTNEKPPSSSIPSKLITKPPLGGGAFKLRPPLRQINTCLPNPSQPNKTTVTHFSRRSSLAANKGNSLGVMTTHSRKPLLEPRRVTIALRPSTSISMSSQSSKGQIMQSTTPMQETNPYMRTPLRSVAEEPSRRFTSATKRQAFFRDPVRVKRYSKIFSPSSQAVAATLMSVSKNSSRFMASPPTQAGSWKPKHPTVIALQKYVLWSPLRSKGLLKSQRQRQSSIFP